MGYASGEPLLWPARPDWSTPVTETLAWLSDAMQAPTGGAQVRQLRAAPRRSFSFTSRVDGDDRRIVDAFRFDAGVQRLALPIYPDVQLLGVPLDLGASVIQCRTAGMDFVEGGVVALWRDITGWETGIVDAIDVDSIALAAPTANAWPADTRIYPVRAARLLDVPRATYKSDAFSTIDVSIAIDEPCDWPAAWPTATLYRGVPVLEWRNDESQDPTDEYDRLTANLDADTGPIYYFDSAGMPLRTQSQRFALLGRAEHTAFRSLAYQLAGQVAQCWVPSWVTDLRFTAAVAASATQVPIPWLGYTRFGYLQQNRRDLAIELTDGTRFYRRITGSAESGDAEILQLDTALGRAVTPGQVRQIGFLSMCASAADTVTIQHDTDADGVGSANVSWKAVKADV